MICGYRDVLMSFLWSQSQSLVALLVSFLMSRKTEKLKLNRRVCVEAHIPVCVDTLSLRNLPEEEMLNYILKRRA